MRNGRRYHLYARQSTTSVHKASPQEFKDFVDKDTDIYYIIPTLGPIEARPPRKFRKELILAQKKMKAWSRQHCPNLLRKIGRPAKLEPFGIDTGDAEPIKLSPRPYSPVDLVKIKEFVEESLANGVISESD